MSTSDSISFDLEELQRAINSPAVKLPASLEEMEEEVKREEYLDNLLSRVIDTDVGHVTIKSYLQALLLQLIYEGEGFNAKRPWGNASWWWVLYEEFIRAGVVYGELDQDGDIVDFSVKECEDLLVDLVRHIFGGEVVEHE